MRRTLVPLLVVLITLCQPMPADAMWWAWLEKWSGPGPFKADPFRTFLFTACVQTSGVESSAGRQEPRKQWALRPSPIARSDAFHREQDAISALLHAAQPDTSQDEFYARLLANPFTPTLRAVATERAFDTTEEKPQLSLRPQNTSPATPQTQAPPAIALLPEPAATRVAAMYGPEALIGPGHEDDRMVCGYFDIGVFESEGDQDPGRGFPPLSARMYDFGPSARIHDGIDIGAGVGWVRFTGSGVDRKQGAFTPFRVVIRPILLALPDTMRKKWMGLLSFYWKETYVWGRLTGADFGAPQSDWAEEGEMIRSFGITLDLTALLPVFNIPLR